MTPLSPSYYASVKGFADTCGQRYYLEGALLERGSEVVGLTGEDDLVQVEVVRATNELAV
jgi:hypothetical protein